MQEQHSRLPVIVLIIFLAGLVITAIIILLSSRTGETVKPADLSNLDTASVLTLADLGNLVPQELEVPIAYRTGAFTVPRIMNVPARFKLSVFAAGLSAPRFFTFDDQGNLYTTQSSAGRVSVLPDNDKDGAADKVVLVDSGLVYPTDVDFYKGDLYVTEVTQVSVYRAIKPDGTYTKKETIIKGLPAGGHTSRTLVIGPDGKIYLAVGSSCNVCEEEDERRAAVSRYNLDGSGHELFATGLRNTVGFLFRKDPVTQESKIWSVDNGRDRIGDDLPPEEVNIIEQGKNYGWPYCYGDGFANPEYPEKMEFCKSTGYPLFKMQAHSAPLDLDFPNLGAGVFPDELADQLFVSFHGSWNRTVPTGYKVVRINTADPAAKEQDFITGFYTGSGEVWGRPVGIVFAKDNTLYISDDKAGAIYKLELRK